VMVPQKRKKLFSVSDFVGHGAASSGGRHQTVPDNMVVASSASKYAWTLRSLRMRHRPKRSNPNVIQRR
jgi:hypothetical protein